MTNRKQPGATFWAAIVVVVVLMYPLSFGPACWLTSRGIFFHTFTARAFYPVVWAATFGPRPIRDGIQWYATVGTAQPWSIGILQHDLGMWW
jgi:hypothetical protein